MSRPLRLIMDEEVLSERGTSVAIYDYAQALRTYQNVDPIIAFDRGRSADAAIVERFRTAFETVSYAGAEDRKSVVDALKADRYYYLKDRKRHIRPFRGTETIAHAIFDMPPDPVATRFTFVSEWLSDFSTAGKVPAVPHIVTLPRASRTLRGAWGIGSDDTVIGRYGSFGTFDVPFVHRAVSRVLQKRRDLWFVFVNTAPFVEHPRVKFLPAIIDPRAKADFIASCDLMLHARFRGESFGLAMAEFLHGGKPVLCWGGGQDRNHLALQPHPQNVYRTEAHLDRLLAEACGRDAEEACVAAVSQFSPHRVAERFAALLLAPGPGPRLALLEIALFNTRRKLMHDASRLRNMAYLRGLSGSSFGKAWRSS